MASSIVDDGGPHEHLVRLEPLPVDCLPAHPALTQGSSEGEGRPTPVDFAREVLQQGDSVIRSLLVAAQPQGGRMGFEDGSTSRRRRRHRSTSWVRTGSKTSDGQTSIQTFRRQVHRAQLAAIAMAGSNCAIARPAWDPNRRYSEGETWLSRVSVHDDDATRSDTASWAEFVHGLKREHAKHEREYTPNVYASHQVLEWDFAPDTVVDHFVEIEMRGGSSTALALLWRGRHGRRRGAVAAYVDGSVG